MQKLRVLFLCTGNSCRSQMAEGWARHLHPDAIEACSAGTAPTSLNPRAVQVMAEAGVDIGSQTSKHVDDLAGLSFDYLITVCGHADEQCPVLAGAQRRLHVGFDDPPRLARRRQNRGASAGTLSPRARRDSRLDQGFANRPGAARA